MHNVQHRIASERRHVHLLDGAVDGEVTVLLVHRVRAGAGIVLDQNAKVLDRVRVLLEHLILSIRNKRTQQYTHRSETVVDRRHECTSGAIDTMRADALRYGRDPQQLALRDWNLPI